MSHKTNKATPTNVFAPTNYKAIFKSLNLEDNYKLLYSNTITDVYKHANKNGLNILVWEYNSTELKEVISNRPQDLPLAFIFLISEETDTSNLISIASNTQIDFIYLPINTTILSLKIKLLEQNYLKTKKPQDDISLEHFIENTPLAFLKININNEIANCNYGLQQLFKYKKSDLIGKPFNTLIHAKQEASNKNWYHVFKALKPSETISVIGVTSNNEPLHLNISAHHKKGETHSQKALLLTINNVSEETKKNNAFENYTKLVENAFLITVFNRNGIITHINNNQQAVSQYSSEELIGKKLKDYYFESHNAKFFNIYRTILKEDFWAGEGCNKKKNGEKYWTFDFISPFKDLEGNIEYFVLMRVDISSVRASSIDFKNTLIAERSLKLKNDFLSNVSHEIRTPLNSILGFTDILLDSKVDKQQKYYLDIVKKSGNLLLNSVNNILDLTRIKDGSHHLNYKPFSLKEALKEAVEMVSFEASVKGNSITENYVDIEEDLLIGDESRLQQIVLNLLKNANKFSEKSSINIKVKKIAEQEESAKYRFEIKDKGIGIKKEQISSIYQLFTQGEDYLTRNQSGLGIGLTIVYKLIQVFNGHIDIKSEENKGTTVIFTITFSKNKNKIGNLKKQKGLRVLLAEDNINNQILARTRLEDFGHFVDIANNGLEVLEKYQENHYDIILMDLQMPILDGYATTKEIRSNFPLEKAKIPIIALTAHTSDGNVEKTKIIGMNDYVYKPFKAQELNDKIQAVIARPSHRINNYNNEIDKVYFCKVDFEYIHNECLGNNKIIKMYIEAFLKEFENFIYKCSFYAGQNDIENIYKWAHKILPSVKSFSLKEILTILENIHKKSKEGKPMEYSHAIAEIANYYPSVKKQLTEKISVI